MATSIGPYLYTRFYIPDILIGLWMTLSIHLFLIALDRIADQNSVILSQARHSHAGDNPNSVILSEAERSRRTRHQAKLASTSRTFQPQRSALLPMLAFGIVLALSVLTKGLIGLVFPLGFVLLYLAFTRQLSLIQKLKPLAATASFLVVAAPWHILAALRNPAIAMPPGVGLPARAGWAWFYLYNEHIARFLGRRIPHDYGQVPIPLFWLLLVLWLFPWAAFLPGALGNSIGQLRTKSRPISGSANDQARNAALVTLLWAGLILGFFTLSSRQEYYHLPALPALALIVGSLLARADAHFNLARLTLRWSLYLLVPIASVLTLICGYFAITAPHPAPGTDLNTLLSSNPALYNLSLGHMFDLTAGAMGFFRGPLAAVAIGMLLLGPLAYFVRRTLHTFAANLIIAAAMIVVLLAAHEGLVRFYPTLGSKDLALAINAARQPGDIILIDGELTSGSTLLFYINQPRQHVGLVNGRINGPWFGSFWPDAPHIFYTDADLATAWHGAHRVFLLTYHPEQRRSDLEPSGPVDFIAASGGKTVLSNQPDKP